MAFAVSTGIKEGFSRGLLSNEAGAGTSSFAHSINTVSSAVDIGILGMGEFIVDTLIFCPLTAISILVSIRENTIRTSGIELIMHTLGSTFFGAEVVLSICIFVFAYATVICWFYYGSRAVNYIFGRGDAVFLILYLSAVLLGSFVGDVFAVAVTDVLLLFLTLITSVTLIKRSDCLIDLSERGGIIKQRLKYLAKPSSHPRI